MRSALWTFVVLLLTSASPAFAQADDATMKVGQRVFLLCRSCHTTEEGGANKIGPNLWHILGRKAGTAANFKYSDAVKNSGIVWSEETISEWLVKPRDFLPGNKMAFAGVPKEEDRKALIAFLKRETGAAP